MIRKTILALGAAALFTAAIAPTTASAGYYGHGYRSYYKPSYGYSYGYKSYNYDYGYKSYGYGYKSYGHGY